jgi:hypothetical protein
MEVVLALAALGVAALTLYSGFGLGTLLLPVLMFFYPPHTAIAATAVVHFLNNCLKLVLVGRHVDRRVFLRFAIPAVPAALLGAWLLRRLSLEGALYEYAVGGRTFAVTTVGLVVGVLIVLFAVLELTGAMKERALPPRFLPLGGVLSGFFGGLSGHQGALRGLVLLKSGLDARAYIATAVAASTLVDFTRLAVYGTTYLRAPDLLGGATSARPLVIAVVAAFVGTFLGVRLLGKVTLEGLHRLVGVLLLLAGLAIATGLSG